MPSKSCWKYYETNRSITVVFIVARTRIRGWLVVGAAPFELREWTVSPFTTGVPGASLHAKRASPRRASGSVRTCTGSRAVAGRCDPRAGAVWVK